jgi:FO synthase subunit 2
MSEISPLLSDELGGHRLNEAEVFQIASAADEIRERHAGDIITYVKNQNLHVTNICKNLCGFCGFGRSPGDEGVYCNDMVAIQAKVHLAFKRGAS